jgi:hypothetical protein
MANNNDDYGAYAGLLFILLLVAVGLYSLTTEVLR